VNRGNYVAALHTNKISVHGIHITRLHNKRNEKDSDFLKGGRGETPEFCGFPTAVDRVGLMSRLGKCHV